MDRRPVTYLKTSKQISNKYKTCSVCGDHAHGYNFNAITCESCKAFFRRNALKEKDFKCPFTKCCEMNIITRRFCQKCRLDKCLAVGMKKEHIRSEENKIKLKRQIGDRMDFKQSIYQSFDRQATIPEGFSSELYTRIQSSDLDSIDSTLGEIIQIELDSCASPKPLNEFSYRKLCNLESAKLGELIAANKGLATPIDYEVGEIVCKNLHMKEVINLTVVAIKRLINMAKHIKAFRELCQEDQIALLKGGCTEIMILRAVMSYDPDKNSWKIPHSSNLANINLDVLKELEGTLYEEHKRFLQSFDPRWRDDENIMLILSAISLFTPERPKVSHRDIVKFEQSTYYHLLQHYIESIYLECEAHTMFIKLVQKMSELHRLNEEHIKVFLDLNPKEIEPLLIEIFDLKY